MGEVRSEVIDDHNKATLLEGLFCAQVSPLALMCDSQLTLKTSLGDKLLFHS